MTEKLHDLRGVEYRSVYRDDNVLITGAEYMRTRHERDTYRAALQRIVDKDHHEESTAIAMSALDA